MAPNRHAVNAGHAMLDADGAKSSACDDRRGEKRVVCRSDTGFDNESDHGFEGNEELPGRARWSCSISWAPMPDGRFQLSCMSFHCDEQLKPGNSSFTSTHNGLLYM